MTDDVMSFAALVHYLNDCCTKRYDPKSQVMKWQPLVASDGVKQMDVRRAILQYFGFAPGPNGITIFGNSKLQAMNARGINISLDTQPSIPDSPTLH